MKICPECQERYADDVETCQKDGEELVDLPGELSKNPQLAEVVAASPSDRTSMIDLEEIEAKRARKKAERAAAARAAGEEVDEDKTPPPEGNPFEDDRDATGTMQKTGRRKKKKEPTQIADGSAVDEGGAAEGDDGDAAEGGDFPPDRRVNEELTDREMSRTGRSRTGTRGGRSKVVRADDVAEGTGVKGTRTGMTRGTAADGTRTRMRKQAKPKRSLSGTQAAFLVMFFLVVVVGAIVFVSRATAVLTVTTVPPGATVVVDGQKLGVSPIQKRMRTGSHVIELSLDDYEPYKEVVGLPAGGLPFLQPLQRKPPPPPPPPSPQQIADEMAKAAQMIFDKGDLDRAHGKLDEALKLFPGCASCTALLAKVDDAIKKRNADAAAAEAAGAREARLSKARVLAEEGHRLYEANQLGAAKEKLYASLKLDANNPEPHRWLGRIFNREDEVDKVRYHLQRYLDLGGADSDFKVREWLKAHPK